MTLLLEKAASLTPVSKPYTLLLHLIRCKRSVLMPTPWEWKWVLHLQVVGETSSPTYTCRCKTCSHTQRVTSEPSSYATWFTYVFVHDNFHLMLCDGSSSPHALWWIKLTDGGHSQNAGLDWALSQAPLILKLSPPWWFTLHFLWELKGINVLCSELCWRMS